MIQSCRRLKEIMIKTVADMVAEVALYVAAEAAAEAAR